MTEDGQADWMQQEERSHALVLRFMVWLSLTFGRRLGRVVLHGITAYFVLFAPTARRASRHYLERALGRPAGWRDGYRHVLSFASTIHDRIYLLNDRFSDFDIEVQGVQAVRGSLKDGEGALLIGAHLGSFEALRAVGLGCRRPEGGHADVQGQCPQAQRIPGGHQPQGHARYHSRWAGSSRCWRCATSCRMATWWACWQTARSAMTPWK